MQTTTRLARDRHLILHALEVLRLIGDCMERKHDVDNGDVELVFGFMRDVAHPCVAADQQAQIEVLFNQMTLAHTNAACDQFVSSSQLYIRMLAPGITQSVLTDELARQHSSRLHQLEVKYTSPHCI